MNPIDRADLTVAMAEVRKVLDFGYSKYPDNEWKRLPVGEHVRHLVAHAARRGIDDESGLPDLAHAAARALMALGVWLREKEELRYADGDRDGDDDLEFAHSLEDAVSEGWDSITEYRRVFVEDHFGKPAVAAAIDSLWPEDDIAEGVEPREVSLEHKEAAYAALKACMLDMADGQSYLEPTGRSWTVGDGVAVEESK